ncbi:AurF N-oxygenase family protein [Nocardioides bruguierae]|uniref:Diiron oxygenase n=1 Tax=Nocardioides bruguierae TaxID=2945102 RepID=A0A9X2IGJ0_9ACTN|nr:diiron oxygenase [Nocardioides bruguierae]MCM0622073.1 diiron oxygenase [Nocardioides bruguierae]
MTTTPLRPTGPETPLFDEHGALDERALEKLGYEQRLMTLSEASVDHHFDAFTDIDWDDPALAVRDDDPRWRLPEADVLGGTDWYRSLPEAEQIRIGLYRQACVAKVGLQFEQLLISGIMNFTFALPNGSPEFRYSTHEATEECHHTQMFQQLVNRTGADVDGGTRFFRATAMLLPLVARKYPAIFFWGVLAGEEPIDHAQKAVLRAGENTHPLLRRIMQIHVAEEARHIGFAHQYLEHTSAKLGRGERFVMSLLVPVLMRWLCNEIVVPSKKAQRDMGIPADVMKQVYWRQPASRKFLRDLFADVRMLAESTGIMNPLARRIWRLLGIDGRASRFRSEPASAAA